MWRIGHKMDWDVLKRCCNWQKRFVALRASSLLPRMALLSCPSPVHRGGICMPSSAPWVCGGMGGKCEKMPQGFAGMEKKCYFCNVAEGRPRGWWVRKRL